MLRAFGRHFQSALLSAGMMRSCGSLREVNVIAFESDETQPQA
jgi:hypothetical protein